MPNLDQNSLILFHLDLRSLWVIFFKFAHLVQLEGNWQKVAHIKIKISIFLKILRNQWQQPRPWVLRIRKTIKVMLDQAKRQNSKELDTTHVFHECTDANSPCVIVVSGHFELSYALENFHGLLIRKSDMINIGLNDLQRVEDRIRALSETRRQKVLDVG